MPQLTRIRLCNIGHSHARIDDLTFRLHDNDGRATHSAIWLRNGGGKTMLVSLLLWLMCPEKRMPDNRRLEDYVHVRDHSILVAEWQLDNGVQHASGQPDRYLTGAFCEWRASASTSDGRKLRRSFFTTRVIPEVPELTLEKLPLYAINEERCERRTWASFRQEWQALSNTYPQAGVNETEQISAWRALLEQAGIDPELFSYQIYMNHHEAEAEALFKFRESDQFVDFFLEMMGNTKLGQATAQTIESFRDALRMQSEQLEPEYRLINALIQHMTPLSNAAQEREDVYRQVLQSWQKLDDVTDYVTQHIREIQQEVTETTQRRDLANAEAQRLRGEAAAQRRYALVLRYTVAKKHLERLHDEQKALQDHIALSKRNEIIWHAALPLQEALRAKAQIKTYQQQLLATQQENAPLLQRLRASACEYAAALQARIVQLSTAEKQHQHEIGVARQQARRARTDATSRQREAVKWESQAQQIAERLKYFLQTCSRLEAEGVMSHGESWGQARERLISQRTNLHLQSDLLSQREKQIIQEQTQLQTAIQGLTLTRSTAAGEEASARARLNQAQEKRTEIEADPLLLDYLELDEVDLDHLDQSALEHLRNRERAFEDRLIQLRLMMAEHEAIAGYLADQHLLPPSRDVMCVLELLRENQITAWSGWEYLTENVSQTDIRAYLQRLPELAFGIVVRDAHYQKAQTFLLQAQPRLDTLVAVLSQVSIVETSVADMLIIGPTSDAYFDRNAGERELQEREISHQQNQDRLNGIYHDRAELRESIKRLEHWQQEYPPAWWNEWRERLADAVARQQTCRVQIDEKQQNQERCVAELEQVRQRLGDCRSETATIDGYLAQLQAHAELFASDPETLEMERLRFLAEAEQKKREARQLEENAVEIDGQEQDLIEQAKLTFAERKDFENDLARVQYLDGEQLFPQTGNIPVLRDRYTQLADQYQQKVGGDAINARLQMAQQEKETALRTFRQRLKAPVDEATVRAALDPNMDADALDQNYHQAVEALTIAKQQLTAKGTEITDAHRLLDEAEQRCQNANVTEEEYHHALPETEEACVQSAEEAERKSDLSNEEARSYQASESEAREQIQVLTLQKHDLEQKQAQARTMLDSYSALYNIAISGIAFIGSSATTELKGEDIDQILQTVGDTLKKAQKEKQRLDEQRTKVARCIRDELSEARDYSKIKLAQQFMKYAEEDYEKRCQHLLEELDVRRKNIENQRAEMQQQRQLVLRHILDLAQNGLDLLKNAARRSKLPASLTAFGQRPFLKITYRELSHLEERSARIDALLDHIIREGVVPNGVELLQKAVRRLAGPITVEVLFPDPDASQPYVPIERMARESGGERLTSTVLLYCTLTQLRAIERTNRIGASSCLILDNPIGAASRPLLLELQREVAQARNIQLIYTTGVQDFEAISMFPNIVCVRNDQRDLKSGERIMQLDETAQGLQAMRILFSKKHTAFQEGENVQ